MIDFFRKDDGKMRKKKFVDRRNCCRRFKDQCGSYLSIRVNARSPTSSPAVAARMQLGRITCKCFAAELPAIMLMTKSSRHAGTLQVLQWRVMEVRQF